MKNNKESIALLVLVAILLGYGFFTYLLKPKLAENADLVTELEQEEMQVKSIYALASNYEEDMQAAKERKQSLQKTIDNFYPGSTQQEDFLRALHNYFTDKEMQLKTIKSNDFVQTFGNEYPGTMTPYVAFFPDEEDLNSSVQRKLEDAAESYPYVDKMNISVEYIGTYDAIKGFLGLLDNAPKTIVCNDLEISLEDEGNNPVNETESELTATLSFIRPVSLTAIEVDLDSLEYEECAMPEEFADGSYRDMFTLENITDAIKEIFRR